MSLPPASPFLCLALCVTLALCVGVRWTPACEGICVSLPVQTRAASTGMGFSEVTAHLATLGAATKL